MPRLDRLPQINRNNVLTFPAQVNDTTPFVALAKPLAACRLAIVTTAGLHRRGEQVERGAQHAVLALWIVRAAERVAEGKRHEERARRLHLLRVLSDHADRGRGDSVGF